MAVREPTEVQSISPPSSAVAEHSPRPVRAVLGLPGYRRYWVGQLGVSIVTGTVRFAFVWLVLELTTSKSVTGVVGLALGLPITFITLPAGVFSDRYDRRRLVAVGSVCGAGVMALTGGLIAADRLNVAGAVVLAAAASGSLAAVQPALQAMVPTLVPRGLLMTGIALQGIGQNVAQLSGVLAGGAAIQFLGLARAFALLAVVLVAAAAVIITVSPVAAGPQRRDGQVARVLRTSLFDGLRYVRAKPPLGTVVLIALVGGTCGGLVQLILPAIAKEEMGVDSLAASLLFAGLGGGMLITTLALASRPALPRQGLLLAMFFSATCGPGMVIMGVTDFYVVALAGLTVWGLGGGFVMTTQRSIIQRHTPDALMGRVISVHTVALTGSFPIAAAISALVVPLLDRRPTLVVFGIASGVLAVILSRRPALRVD